MVRIAMKNVNKRVEPEVSPAKAGLLSIDPKLVLHSSIIIITNRLIVVYLVFIAYNIQKYSCEILTKRNKAAPGTTLLTIRLYLHVIVRNL